jgi:hypothetical protein
MFAIQILPADNHKRSQNAADDKESAVGTQGTDRVELQCAHWPLTLLNSKYLISQNKTDHIQLNTHHCVPKMLICEVSWCTESIQQIIPGTNEHLIMLVKTIITGKSFKI